MIIKLYDDRYLILISKSRDWNLIGFVGSLFVKILYFIFFLENIFFDNFKWFEYSFFFKYGMGIRWYGFCDNNDRIEVNNIEILEKWRDDIM